MITRLPIVVAFGLAALVSVAQAQTPKQFPLPTEEQLVEACRSTAWTAYHLAQKSGTATQVFYLYINYRELRKTVRDRAPLAETDKFMDGLADSNNYFTTSVYKALLPPGFSHRKITDDSVFTPVGPFNPSDLTKPGDKLKLPGQPGDLKGTGPTGPVKRPPAFSRLPS